MRAAYLLHHGSPRLVYGVALARNFREYLLGINPEPEYLAPMGNPRATTDAIVDWWVDRWLVGRIEHDRVLNEVARNKLTYPIRHGARVVIPDGDGNFVLPFENSVESDDELARTND